ncbi:enoyl-CoA hydratase/isomerase family protein [Nocardia anaemiae]|uniref:enoyl-CoA hydratase/isomerase family protein n=1 Tax=Nocardia anaemiae TaxID=263910 RepID=UPI0007A4AE22|nr:enoyl-CoA hydratase/isomerase family protein [Nocardia anaemiae]
MSSSRRLRTRHRGRVLIVEFDNPPRHFYDEQTSIELEALTRAVQRDRTVGAVLFTGRGSSYLTHFDVPTMVRAARTTRFRVGYPWAVMTVSAGRLAVRSQLANRVLASTPARDLMVLARTYAALDRLNRSDKVIVTAINGMALGMGCVFALACDIRLTADDIELGLPESALAVLAAGGGTQRLIRAVGTSRALDMLLDGRRLTAAQAHELGLVHYVVPGDELRRYGFAVADRLARRSSVVNREIKRAVYRAGTRPLPAALRSEAAGLVTTLTSRQALRSLDAYHRHLSSQDELTDDAVIGGWIPLLEDGVPPEDRSR